MAFSARLNSPPAVPKDTQGIRTLRYNLDTLDEYLDIGEKFSMEGRGAEAVDLLREAVLRWPDSALAHYDFAVAAILEIRRGKAHLELWENLGDEDELIEEAIFALQTAIGFEPELVPAYNNLARLMALRGRQAEAIAAWETSLELEPDQSEVRADLQIYRSNFAPRASSASTTAPDEENATQF